MAKVITLPYKGAEYTLEYTRRTVEAMERSGFIASDITDKPVTGIPALFAGAFKAHHPKLSKQKIDDIYNGLGNRGELIGKLAEMYADPIKTLLDDPEESKGNAGWTANW